MSQLSAETGPELNASDPGPKYPAEDSLSLRQFGKFHIIGRNDVEHVRISCSAYGEDLICWAYLGIPFGRTPEKLRYLDIGTNHYMENNNTYFFYVHGATGVLVEPNPEMAEHLRHNRPRDLVLQAGIAFDERKSAQLTRFNNSVFNTFISDKAEALIEQSKTWPGGEQQVMDTIDCDLIDINEVLATHFADEPPHLVTIDAEGVDFTILQQYDFERYAPLCLCCEISNPLEEFMELLGPHGYKNVMRSPDNFVFTKLI